MTLPIDSLDEIRLLAERLTELNDQYRQGAPAVSDRQYDLLVDRLRELDPDHPFLHRVEPEIFSGKREVRHPVPMLSRTRPIHRQSLNGLSPGWRKKRARSA